MAKRKQSGAGQRRKEQKRIALEAGFTPQQADKMRDYSEARFQETLRSRRLQSVPKTQRGFLDSKAKIRREKLKGDKTRQDIWSMYAKHPPAFPRWMERLARRINRKKRLPRDDSYGWRAVYHHYTVEGLDSEDDYEDDAITFAESYEELASA